MINISIFSEENIIFSPVPGYELSYYEKKMNGVYEFYSEHSSIYGEYIEKEGKYYYYKYEADNRTVENIEKLLRYYTDFVKKNRGDLHYQDEDELVFVFNNTWCHLSVDQSNYRIIAIESKVKENNFYSYHEIKENLITNGKIFLPYINFEDKNIQIDSSGQLKEFVKFLNDFEDIGIKICIYEKGKDQSNKEKGELIKKYLKIFGQDSSNIRVIEKENLKNHNGMVVFY